MRKRGRKNRLIFLIVLLVCFMCSITLVLANEEQCIQKEMWEDDLATKEPDDNREQLLQKEIDEIVDYLNVKEKDDKDKIFAVYNYVCQNVEYDWQATNDMSSWDGVSLGYGQFAYEALCQKKAVCAGISKAIYRLLSQLNVECYYVTGLSSGIPHAWNIVQLDGLYYYLDATSDIGKLKYKFFLKGTVDFIDYGIDNSCLGAMVIVNSTSLYDSIDALTESKDGFRYNAGSGDITILSYDGNEEHVVVPSVIDGRSVKRIVQYAFYDNDLVTLELSEGIECVESLFVVSCRYLEKIILPSTVKLVANGSDTFVSGTDGFVDGCDKLKAIEVDDDNRYLTVIDDVLYNKELTSIIAYPSAATNEVINIPEGVTAIKGDAFAYNNSIRKVVLPESVTSIGYWAFNWCSKLEEINIPSNCKFIGQFAFQGTNIKNIYIPADSTCTIMPASFCWAPLESIVVEDGNPMYRVEDGVLYNENNNALLYEVNSTRERLSISEGTKFICQSAFSGCKYLKEVTIPESVKTVGHGAFSECEQLEIVNIEGEGLENVEGAAFLNCSKVQFTRDYTG